MSSAESLISIFITLGDWTMSTGIGVVMRGVGRDSSGSVLTITLKKNK